MKAIAFRSYGPPNVLHSEEMAKPVPGDGEVLVKVRASSVNPSEWYAMTGLFLARLGNGLIKPKEIRLGTDFSGVVEAVGRNVPQFKPGDEVFGARRGAFAEYVCASKFIFPKPVNISFEQAGGVAIAGITALQGLRDHGKLQSGQTVLINGASGGVGTFAIQIAKVLGAEVTAVCSPDNVELARSLGADHVVDYTREDFTRKGQRYDLFLDIAGSRPWRDCRLVLKPESKFVVIGAPKGNRWIGPLGHIIRLKAAAWAAHRQVTFFVAAFNCDDFLLLQDMLAHGKITPVVERVYPLAQISDAMHHLGQGHARGKIIVTMS